MKKKYSQFVSLILVTIFLIFYSQKIYSQDSLSADTPFIEVNGKVIKFGSAIIAFSKIQQSKINFDQKTIFSQIVQQLVNEELLSQKIEKENQLTLLALEHEKRSAKAAQMVSKILKKFPSDELVNSAYQNLTDQLKGSLEYNASHILVNEEDQAKNILKDLNAGTDFEDLAKKHSVGPTAKNGGKLNWFDLNTMVPEFSTALMVLSEGDVSQPVKTKFGWHVIMLFDKRISDAKSKEEMSQQLAQNITKISFARIIETLRANAEIEKIPLSNIQSEWQRTQKNILQ